MINGHGGFGDQVDYVMSKIPFFATAPTAKLNKYSNVNPRIIVNVARSYMMSTLLYGAQITPWGTAKGIKGKMKRIGKYERQINCAAFKSPKAAMEAAYVDTGWIPFQYQALAMYVGYTHKLAELANKNKLARVLLEWSWKNKNKWACHMFQAIEELEI